MPKSETPQIAVKKAATKAGKKKISSSHFPSKPYMRALRAQSPTSVPTAAWSTTDDELLLRTKSSGKKWVEVSPLFPGKTSNACRKRHARLVTHAQVEWDEFKERDLAMEFVNAKVGFFKAIAVNLKLEWRQVEKKCLELGFKTLMEKGKRISLPFPPLEFQQTIVGDAGLENTTREGEPSSIQIKSGPELTSYPSISTRIKVESHPEPSDSGDGILQVRLPRRQKGPRVCKKEQLTAQDEDYEEEMTRDGGDELDDLDNDDDALPKILAKDKFVTEGFEL